MLNEFAYCPRLAYLEWVQGEFADNLETLEGRFGHRRVDRPDRQEVPEPGGPHPSPLPKGEGTVDGQPEVIHSRSVMLSASGEKLIAKIDLLDLENSVAMPSDYKRGRVPDVPGSPGVAGDHGDGHPGVSFLVWRLVSCHHTRHGS